MAAIVLAFAIPVQAAPKNQPRVAPIRPAAEQSTGGFIQNGRFNWRACRRMIGGACAFDYMRNFDAQGNLIRH
jgi:hypothetical protein